ncbi:hypothetical protein [Burkholderia pseudomallei]|uniref:hypothetical protein n=1 Tax=Burkholderia pseudomallei TaxID=28450 RepID=UPI000F08A565|nr:hypothetical protein [Burkholderia pseudomallei]MBF3650915.1 hypothetical protein [Burkholderia pseudomallei]MBF3668905.1 hypothetical protein [Burkholderia pseudomallei]MBF3774362.1 hypothetical protein [Burkholderia pseudomallei]MBF3873418.1 hypothetical protein [Burkholderia pseudomallei]MBF3907689.1 hypothetical protein [Burkholderia pseudomallei]
MNVRHRALPLAVLATSTALSLSILAGLQRGGTLPERLIWIAIGTVLVTSAHLLPVLIRDTPIPIRGMGSLLWAACLATACYGHAGFFAFAQQHAGEQRASTVQAGPAPSSARSLTAVMVERAAVTAQLASANARYCAGNCVTLAGRRVTLAAKVDALNAEADEIRRLQAATDRITTQRDRLLVDPVTARLAVFLGTTVGRVDLLTGLGFAAVLEGVACLLWTVTLRSPLPAVNLAATKVTPAARSTVTATADVTPPVVTSVADVTRPVLTPVAASRGGETLGINPSALDHSSVVSSDAPCDDRVTALPAAAPIDDHLAQLARDVAAGLVRPTVADIRRHLGCAQGRAAELRRQLAAISSTS